MSGALPYARIRVGRGEPRKPGTTKALVRRRPWWVQASSLASAAQAPPVEWIKDRLENLQAVLENRAARSAKVLRDLLGAIRPELVTLDIGRPFYRAITSTDALALNRIAPRWCGGRFEFFAKVDADAKNSNRSGDPG